MEALIPRLARSESGSFGLFGPEHLGKRGLAELFIREALGLSAHEPLDAHPDIAILDGAQEGKVQVIRALLERVHQTSARGGKRLFLIDHADALNTASCNALLKDIEEPRSGVLFLLVASREASLPATVRSRLVPLRLDLASKEEMRELAKERGFPAVWADEALRRPGLMIRRSLDQAWWEALQQQVHALDAALRHAQPGALIAALDAWQKSLDKREDAAQQWRILLLCLMDRYTASPWSRTGVAYVETWRLLEGAIPARIGMEVTLARLVSGEYHTENS